MDASSICLVAVFMDDVTADRSHRMNSEVFRAVLSPQIEPNAAKVIPRHFTVQMDNGRKQNVKATQEFKRTQKLDTLQCPSQSPDFNSTKHALQLLKTNLKAERSTNKQHLKAVKNILMVQLTLIS